MDHLARLWPEAVTSPSYKAAYASQLCIKWIFVTFVFSVSGELDVQIIKSLEVETRNVDSRQEARIRENLSMTVVSADVAQECQVLTSGILAGSRTSILIPSVELR